jgi:3-phenylpropionate/trans-cinnamate dioxygenase ferredoxin component
MSDATFRPVGSADELAPGTVNPYYLEDRKQRIAIARVGDALYAFDDLHADGSLSAGLLEGTTIMSQCDGSRFDISTGAVIDGPTTRQLGVYPVRESGGQLEIQV